MLPLVRGENAQKTMSRCIARRSFTSSLLLPVWTNAAMSILLCSVSASIPEKAHGKSGQVLAQNCPENPNWTLSNTSVGTAMPFLKVASSEAEAAGRRQLRMTTMGIVQFSQEVEGTYSRDSTTSARLGKTPVLAMAQRGIAAASRRKGGHIKFKGIPGSNIIHKNVSAWKFRRKMNCLSKQGSWVYRPDPRQIPWNTEGLEHCDRQWVGGGRGRLAGHQANSATDASRWRVRESLKYRWEAASSCGTWMDFKRSWFCSALNNLGGNLMLVGDSITRYMMNNLRNHLAMPSDSKNPVPGLRSAQLYTPPLCKMWEDRRHMPRNMKLCKVMTPCPNPNKVFHVRNDWLTMIQDRPMNDSHGYFVPWWRQIEHWGVRGVLLNRGVHYQPLKRFRDELKQVLSTLRDRYPHLLIMYRGTPVGHADCDNYERPLKTPQKEKLPFHWSDLPEQNAVAKEVVEYYGGVYLDVETMTALRADGHFGTFGGKVDCMHYCNPGPVDEWTKILFNAMIELL